MPKLNKLDWGIIILGILFILVPYTIEDVPVRVFGVFIECFIGLLYITERANEKWEKRKQQQNTY
jgi:hypothetical protein